MPHVSRFTFHAIIVILMLLACGCRPFSASVTTPTDITFVLAEYQEWTQITAEPRNVSIALWLLCRTPNEHETAFLESEHGDLYLQVYVNNIGQEAMMQAENPVFPVGSVIVKEKLLQADSQQPEALGMMIKREAGFNPAGGDWEYVYWTADSVTQGEALAHCQECHLGQTETDSVFRPYVTFEHSE